jgi:hypothetical protein
MIFLKYQKNFTKPEPHYAAKPHKLTSHSAALRAAHEGEKVEFALQAGAASPHREAPKMLVFESSFNHRTVRRSHTCL